MKKELPETITEAFQTIVCRQPQKQEISRLQSYYQENIQKLTREKAVQLLDAPDESKQYPAPVETAALMQTVHLIYNLEETSMR